MMIPFAKQPAEYRIRVWRQFKVADCYRRRIYL